MSEEEVYREEVLDSIETEAEEKGTAEEKSLPEVHPFDRMFFGRRQPQTRLFPSRSAAQPQQPQQQANNGGIEGMLDGILNNETFKNIDFDEMLTHIDKLMVSLGELRPMFKKVTPFMEKFLQKDK